MTRLLILSWQKIVCIRDYTRDLALDQGISNVIYPNYPRNFRIICFVKYIRVAWPTPCRANTTELWKPCWTSLNADIWELLAIKCFCLNIHSEQDNSYVCVNEVSKSLCVRFLNWHHLMMFLTQNWQTLADFEKLKVAESLPCRMVAVKQIWAILIHKQTPCICHYHTKCFCPNNKFELNDFRNGYIQSSY